MSSNEILVSDGPDKADLLRAVANPDEHLHVTLPKSSIDDRYRDTPYYLAPEDKVGQEAFTVIRDAMAKKKMVGIARVVMARRERVMMLEPFGKGIMGTNLLYPYEIRGEDAVFEDIPDMKLPDQMIGLAEDIIDRMSGKFEPEKFEDRYENAMIELIRSKQAGLPAPKEKAPAKPANVVNLMDALRRSIEDTGGGKVKPAKAAAKKVEPAARKESGAGMTGIQFHEALWTLMLLRREELVAEDIIEAGDDAMWAKFAADRVGWAMMNPAQRRSYGGPSGAMILVQD